MRNNYDEGGCFIFVFAKSEVSKDELLYQVREVERKDVDDQTGLERTGMCVVREMCGFVNQ